MATEPGATEGRIRLAGMIHARCVEAGTQLTCGLPVGIGLPRSYPPGSPASLPWQRRGWRGLGDRWAPASPPSLFSPCVCSGRIILHVSRGLTLMDEQNAASSSVHLFPPTSPPPGQTLQPPLSLPHTERLLWGLKQRGLLAWPSGDIKVGSSQQGSLPLLSGLVPGSPTSSTKCHCLKGECCAKCQASWVHQARETVRGWH